MSWFFGIIRSDTNTPIESNYEKLHSKTLLKIALPNLYLAFGGIDETCIYEVQNESQNKGWAVVGLGIHFSGSSTKIINKDGWRKILSSGTPQTDNLDGHFVALRWDDEKIEFFTDQLGLRTAYYGKCNNGICFSSRLDWVAKTTGLQEINKAALGGRWLLFNQLSYDSCVNGIERLGPSSHVIIKKGSVTEQISHPWLPEFGNEIENKAKTTLEALVHVATNSNHLVSLGLSGGFDSRTLLAILMAIKDVKFCVHTFGEPFDPDVILSENIAHEFKLDRQYFNDPIPDSEELISILQTFVAQNLLVEPVSSILRLRYYPLQHANGQMIIDGGFGEIARRQYLNRLVRLGQKALREGDIHRIFNLLRTQRADIFAREYTNEIEFAAHKSLETTLSAMPSVTEIGVENFADLLSVRTRVPNFGGPEQSRSDGFIVNFMPMVQPSFLRAAFCTNLHYRNNGRFYKEIIQTYEPRLKKFPLVKSGTTYPFGLPLPVAWALTKIKNKIVHPFSDHTPDRFLWQLKDYVLDIANSEETKNWHYYDKRKVPLLMEEYYKGDKRLVKFVDWWLTFEIWRRSLKN